MSSIALCHFLGLAPILVFETPNACLLGKAELLRKADYCDLYRLMLPKLQSLLIFANKRLPINSGLNKQNIRFLSGEGYFGLITCLACK